MRNLLWQYGKSVKRMNVDVTAVQARTSEICRTEKPRPPERMSVKQKIGSTVKRHAISRSIARWMSRVVTDLRSKRRPKLAGPCCSEGRRLRPVA